MVLAHLCSSCNMDFSIAHCNFNLRGEESDRDEELVRGLAKHLGRDIYVTRFNTMEYVARHRTNVQLAARELRYAWFSKIMKDKGIKTLVTAHHANDSLETFLINLSRGTGIEGLTGIPSLTDTLSRPLLQFSRADILCYAQEHSLDWREDASNQNTKYLRNNIRHNIVPKLMELHPNFLENFLKTQEYLGQTQQLSQNHISQIRDNIFIKEDGVEKVGVATLLALSPTKAYLYYFFKDYGFTQWEDINGLLTAISGKEVHSTTHRLLKNREFLMLKPKTKNDGLDYSIHEGENNIHLPIKLDLKEVAALGETSPKVLYVDKEKLKYPLIVRKCKKGDYFYPLGMKGRKKVSKFFKDQKMDIFSKENQWLLCSDNNIVWIIGKRADDRFKITANTKNIIKISLLQ